MWQNNKLVDSIRWIRYVLHTLMFSLVQLQLIVIMGHLPGVKPSNIAMQLAVRNCRAGSMRRIEG